ncbi:N-acyl-D-amino-acid deacylase family protein [Fodinibius salsisoli]|uniref:Amidohydrolase family protein n=1 Tax=Fodinibius salsisoli TaxID=2820877 RepID=A0ABT3PLH9_9BACT|nr:amidohydrolase family protein [Fodinibius salsisoli]MCW9706720.1 amidohydrolase family protein [Fodinibius salsisoli]
MRKITIPPIFIGLFIFFGVECTSAQWSWDWHIAGGMVIDGSGEESFRADLLIRDDSIAYIGQVNADTIDARDYVDASGKVISPGFIDVHAHGDPLEDPQFRNFLGMGVTTIVLGQDGRSPSVGSLDSWFAKVEQQQLGVNIAMLSGHGSIRSQVDVGRQTPTEGELRKMERLLESDLKEGALGMSTGLEYVPGIYSKKEELLRLSEVVGRHNGLVMSHMRSEDNADVENSLEELAEQGRVANVHASHLKVVYGKGTKRAEEILDYLEQFRNEGITISADVYPYAASFTGIGIVFPDWAKTETGWQNAMQERPKVLRAYLKKKVNQRNGPGAILFGSGQYAGQTLKEAATGEQKDPVDLLLEMGPQSASAAHFVMDQELQDRIVTGQKVMISSDGSPTMRHPRGYGSFAKIIRYYVFEKELLSLEEAIYKMSGLPAKTIGLKKRGILKEGSKADMLIFDPSNIQDRATFEHPHRLAKGFDWIMINGKLTKKDGEFNSNRFGKVLKKE